MLNMLKDLFSFKIIVHNSNKNFSSVSKYYRTLYDKSRNAENSNFHFSRWAKIQNIFKIVILF